MIRHIATLFLLTLVASCAQHPTFTPSPQLDDSLNPALLTPDLYASDAGASNEPIVRYGRYTLVSTHPDRGQQDLMEQVIDIAIPIYANPNVGEAMRYVLNRSGYTLCPPDSAPIKILYKRPLPAAHYKLGPMTLRSALQLLAGSAWQVSVDEVNRTVCYVMRPGYRLLDPPLAGSES
jgi:type IV pili sensor histidine kinase/response regulator